METEKCRLLELGKCAESTKKRVAYVYSDKFIKECDRGCKVTRRASMVHTLIEAYQLLPYLDVVAPKVATVEELADFHSEHYIEHLISINDVQDIEKVEDISLEYGLGYDCPLIPRVFDYVAAVAGGTVSAAQCLVDGGHRIAINWNGGWHHGRKDEASGFCYVNDVVLGILKLRTTFDRVLYIDLDLHHGDGVEDAFAYTSKVMTVSLHKYDAGFFPGTGHVNDVGCGRAQNYAVNVPLKSGIKDEQFFNIFSSVMQLVKPKFHASAIVCQCGADGLAGDPMASFGLTHIGIGQCVKEILSWDIPTLYLGGGGYNFPNTARCWTYLSSLILGQSISSDIPDNPFFISYGPGYDLEITPSNRVNDNTESYENEILSIISKNVKNIS